jgi:uncharacterized protein YcbX
VDAFVDALWVYPVKSCKGIAVDGATVESRGLRGDRRWMIVDERGVFLTQRTEPRMALIEVTLDSDSLALRAPGLEELRLPGLGQPAQAAEGDGSERPRRRVQVWREKVDAVDCGPEAARWISRWLGMDLALVFMPDDVRRPVKPAYALPDDIVGFADAFPLLLASTSSLDDLNARLDTPLPMNRFRPNIVIRGTAPWEEDEWARIRVGALEVRVAKACERCAITTVDQETAERGVEPLRTLAEFRRRDNDVLFAQNAVPDSPGSIAVGDRVHVLERQRK